MPEPWIKVKIGMGVSDKVAALPNDSARWGYVLALLAAKVQRRMGTFASRAHLMDVLGRRGRYFDDYVAAGLVHVAPLACDECRRRHPDARRPEVVIHDYLKEQRDPTNADRQAEHRNEHRNAQSHGASNATDNGAGNESDNADRNATDNADRNAPLTRAGDDGDSDVENDESLSQENRSPTPSREAEPGTGERADVQALLDRGWPRVTQKQRAILDEVLDRHNVTGPAWAARIIAEAAPDADPLTVVKMADKVWQNEQRERAENDEATWNATKAAERNGAVEELGELEAFQR